MPDSTAIRWVLVTIGDEPFDDVEDICFPALHRGSNLAVRSRLEAEAGQAAEAQQDHFVLVPEGEVPITLVRDAPNLPLGIVQLVASSQTHVPELLRKRVRLFLELAVQPIVSIVVATSLTLIEESYHAAVFNNARVKSRGSWMAAPKTQNPQIKEDV